MDQATLKKFIARSIVDKDGCWLWTSFTGGRGYARIRIPTGHLSMHREAYEHFVEPIPAGMTIDHLCRVRHCVNPAHMEVVDLVENVMRGESPIAQNARKTHCIHGHIFDAENTRYSKKGYRSCRACGREWMRHHRQALRDLG